MTVVRPTPSPSRVQEGPPFDCLTSNERNEIDNKKTNSRGGSGGSGACGSGSGSAVGRQASASAMVAVAAAAASSPGGVGGGCGCAGPGVGGAGHADSVYGGREGGWIMAQLVVGTVGRRVNGWMGGWMGRMVSWPGYSGPFDPLILARTCLV